MTRPQLIAPRADAACGRMFFADHRTANEHRIALEVWNRATGRGRPGHQLTVRRCGRCGGFHLVQRPVPDRPPPQSGSRPDDARHVELFQSAHIGRGPSARAVHRAWSRRAARACC